MHKNKKPTHIDSIERTITHIRDKEKNICISIALSMYIDGEPIEKITKYTRVDAEEIQSVIDMMKDIAKYESETKSRTMTCRFLDLRNQYQAGIAVEGKNNESLLRSILE